MRTHILKEGEEIRERDHHTLKEGGEIQGTIRSVVDGIIPAVEREDLETDLSTGRVDLRIGIDLHLEIVLHLEVTREIGTEMNLEKDREDIGQEIGVPMWFAGTATGEVITKASVLI